METIRTPRKNQHAPFEPPKKTPPKRTPQRSIPRPKITPFPAYEDDVILSPSWRLTRDHREGSHGIPVLVYNPTGMAFGAKDTIPALLAIGRTQLASDLVLRLLTKLPPRRQEKARRFLLYDRQLLPLPAKKPRKEPARRRRDLALTR